MKPMVLSELLANSPAELAATPITGITADSRRVTPGCAFLCLRGSRSDGHAYARAAEESGAAVIVAEEDTGCSRQVLVKDTHAAFAQMSANWFGRPAEKLRLIGVTGTNGKTSVTFMIKQILEHCGHTVGLIGTIQNMIRDQIIPSDHTTPDCYELNALFSKMVEAGCEFAVMEVSSHALDQKRVYGLDFEVAVFTNLTQDHLDYHKTMENYLAAKKRLFSMCRSAVINTDDPYADQIREGLSCPVYTVSLINRADYQAREIAYEPGGVSYRLAGRQNGTVHTAIGGKFTVYNTLSALAAADVCHIPIDEAIRAVGEMTGVKGRAQVVPGTGDFSVILDYAHTPDGLQNILSAFRECTKNRLIVVFGCGGDRDKTKRPKMGEIAARLADFVVVTSDNPRSEEPAAIIRDILAGVQPQKTPYTVIENRKEAIEYALSHAEPGDVVILAGKGHETYQIFADRTIHFDENEIVAEFFKKQNGGLKK